MILQILKDSFLELQVARNLVVLAFLATIRLNRTIGFTHGYYSVHNPLFKTALKQLEKEGHISVKTHISYNNRVNRYTTLYAITDKGEQSLSNIEYEKPLTVIKRSLKYLYKSIKGNNEFHYRGMTLQATITVDKWQHILGPGLSPQLLENVRANGWDVSAKYLRLVIVKIIRCSSGYTKA